MKKIILGIVFVLLFMPLIQAQNKKTIKIIVPNKTDEVYIVGNQEALGNWNPKSIKMDKVSDYERSISVELSYPVEFKFTRGDWTSEGIIHKLYNNPNQKMENEKDRNLFVIKSWTDQVDSEALGIDYSLENFSSKVLNAKREIRIALPENYNPNKTYPVVYITDGGTSNFTVVQNYLETLSGNDYDIIPETILVGINHGMTNNQYNRNKDLDVFYTETGKKFKTFLFDELVPYINSKFKTTGFNVMIGHSNGAEYNHFLLLEPDNPFRAFLSISTSFNTDVRAK